MEVLACFDINLVILPLHLFLGRAYLVGMSNPLNDSVSDDLVLHILGVVVHSILDVGVKMPCTRLYYVWR